MDDNACTEKLDKQHTFSDIRTKRITYMPKVVPVYYYIRHIKRRLIEHIGKKITVT